MPCLHIYISGKVQGVSFRYYLMKEAQRLGILGWVKNLEDGRMEVIAQSKSEALQEFLRHCRKGPPYAEVERVDMEEVPEQELDGFEVKYD
ncbi:MAG TPA: acylphosphatase [Candidatus Nanoarchaeia archaeon]|nr:acylphosphatase [Candidatus Nanoarchaeia archaeon]